MPDNPPKGWVKTTLGEVCAINPRTPFDESVSDDTEVSFVPMAAVEEVLPNLRRNQVVMLERNTETGCVASSEPEEDPVVFWFSGNDLFGMKV
jgi:hypothetical protein